MHTPVEVTEEAIGIVRDSAIDGTVAIGGGSTTGLGKAIAVRTDLPQIVIPTTYAGSEMTNLLGETAKGEKKTRRDPKIRPETVIYDVDLTLSLPPALSATSGMNAIAHAVEGLYARDGNPIIRLMAEEGIRALGKALPAIVRDPHDRDARSDALYGAWLCGMVLAGAEVALHHKLCHVLGGSFDLPHAETHAVILPHVAAYNAKAAPEAIARVARALGVSDAAPALFDLDVATGAPTALRDIGMPEDRARPGRRPRGRQTPTGIRDRSTAARSARCSTMRGMDGDPSDALGFGFGVWGSGSWVSGSGSHLEPRTQNPEPESNFGGKSCVTSTNRPPPTP